jgi:hypothetical protein
MRRYSILSISSSSSLTLLILWVSLPFISWPHTRYWPPTTVSAARVSSPGPD